VESSSLLNVSSFYIISETISGAEFHDQLNPALWNGRELRPEIQDKLLYDANAFIKKLDDPTLGVLDIQFVGSNAAFNYTPTSDIDVHVIVDYNKLDYKRVARRYFFDKKAIWDSSYQVKVKGFDVEFYVEDVSEPFTSNGIYSLLKKTWIKSPIFIPTPRNDRAVMTKVDHLKKEIQQVIDNKATDVQITQLRNKIHDMRASGLAKDGEYSTENLAFKVLRSSGLIQKLRQANISIINHELSLI